MCDVASIIKELSLDYSELTIIKIGSAMIPLSYTTLYLIIPSFRGLDLITQAMFSLSLFIILTVASLFLSNIFNIISENDNGIFIGLSFFPSFVTFGVTLICEAFGNRKSLQDFIYIFAGAYFVSFLLSIHLALMFKKVINAIKKIDRINVGDNTSEQGT